MPDILIPCFTIQNSSPGDHVREALVSSGGFGYALSQIFGFSARRGVAYGTMRREMHSTSQDPILVAQVRGWHYVTPA